jgi:hypothetical protein
VHEWTIVKNDYVLTGTFDPKEAVAEGLYVASGNTKGNAYTGVADAYFVFYMTTTIPLSILN